MYCYEHAHDVFFHLIGRRSVVAPPTALGFPDWSNGGHRRLRRLLLRRRTASAVQGWEDCLEFYEVLGGSGNLLLATRESDFLLLLLLLLLLMLSSFLSDSLKQTKQKYFTSCLSKRSNWHLPASCMQAFTHVHHITINITYTIHVPR